MIIDGTSGLRYCDQLISSVRAGIRRLYPPHPLFEPSTLRYATAWRKATVLITLGFALILTIMPPLDADRQVLRQAGAVYQF